MSTQKIINVIIVEDNEEVRDYLETALSEDVKINLVATYVNGNDAVSFMSNHDVDVVVMDIGLPDQSGITCVKELKDQGLQTEFLMHTVFDSSHQVFEALKNGATGYMLKNTPQAKLIDAIVEVANGGAPMSPSIARKVAEYFDERKANIEIASKLTTREYEILGLLSKGKLYKEIAQDLGITVGTVKQHNHKIYQKLHVQNKTEAINKYLGRS